MEGGRDKRGEDWGGRGVKGIKNTGGREKGGQASNGGMKEGEEEGQD